MEELTVFIQNVKAAITYEVKEGRDVDWLLDALDVTFANHFYPRIDRAILHAYRSAVYQGAIDEIIRCGLAPRLRRMSREAGPSCAECGHIYAIKSATGQVKIGRSINPLARVASISTQAGVKPSDIFISPKIAGYKKAERDLHKIFGESRKIGEWFDVDFGAVVSAIGDLQAGKITG